MLRVSAYTGGRDVPAARYRVRQMISPLRMHGIEVEEHPARFGQYPPRRKYLRPAWGVAAVIERGLTAVSDRADVTLLQREMVSKLITVERLTRTPRVLDVDDAIWLHSERTSAWLARLSEMVICGNEFLASKFSQWNANVEVIPTAVDTSRFKPSHGTRQRVMGWSGTSGGFKFLYEIEPALATVFHEDPLVKLRVISDRPPRFKTLAADRIEYIRWTPEIEVDALQDLSIGLMPLDSSDWSRGKCSFKMLTYMSCGLPVVVSNVGMNREVLSRGEPGIGASTDTDWVEGILQLLRSPDLRNKMGAEGRRIVEEHFSVNVVASRIAKTLKRVAGEKALTATR